VLQERPSAVYRIFDTKGELIYVGVAYSPKVRISFHRHNKPWGGEIARYEVDWHESRDAAEAAEEQLIADIWPRYNVLGTPEHRLRSLRCCSVEAQARAAERSRADYAARGR
jgi:excinuclease UvrABC nuclease subunit